MSNRNRRKKHKRAINPYINYKQINITRYTLDAWLKCYPQSNEEEWAQRTLPGDPYGYANQYREAFELDDTQIIQLVTIDECYFQWLKETGKENTDENRALYASLTSSEVATELFLRDPDNVPIELYALPVIFIVNTPAKHYSFQLDQNARVSLTHYFEHIWGKGNVYVPGYLMRPDIFCNQAEQLVDMAITYFDEGVNVSRSEYETQESDEKANCLFYCIPVAIQIERENAKFVSDNMMTMREIVRMCPDAITFDRETLDELGKQQMSTFEQCGAQKAIRGSFNKYAEYAKGSLAMFESLVYVEDIPEVYEQWVAEVARTFKNKDIKKGSKPKRTKIINIARSKK